MLMEMCLIKAPFKRVKLQNSSGLISQLNKLASLVDWQFILLGLFCSVYSVWFTLFNTVFWIISSIASTSRSINESLVLRFSLAHGLLEIWNSCIQHREIHKNCIQCIQLSSWSGGGHCCQSGSKAFTQHCSLETVHLESYSLGYSKPFARNCSFETVHLKLSKTLPWRALIALSARLSPNDCKLRL